METEVRDDELAFGPGVERGVCVGPENVFQGVQGGMFGDDEGKRTSDDGGVDVEPRREHRHAKRTCRNVRGYRRRVNAS